MERVIDRSELASEPSTSPSTPDLQAVKGLDDFEFVKHDEANSQDDGQSNEDELMEFVLFAPTTKSEPVVAKIRAKTPPLSTGTSGFIDPYRDQSYYFTHELSAEQKANFDYAAVSTEDVLAHARRMWPGTACPWKVIHIQDSKRQRILSNDPVVPKLLDNTLNSKRRRPGKKARIKTRTKLAAAKARQEESRKAAERKEADEREKRTRRNREKKVKKKQREKAKKVEGASAEEEQNSDAPA